MIICLLLCSCNKNETIENDSYKVGYSSNLIDEKDRNELKNTFDKYKLSNDFMDIFQCMEL